MEEDIIKRLNNLDDTELTMLVYSQVKGRMKQLIEVLDDRERFVEFVQQSSPLLIFGRTAKPDLVVIDGVPPHEQQIGLRMLDPTRKRQAAESRHRRNDALCLGKSRLELRLTAWLDGEKRVFDDAALLSGCHGVTLTNCLP